MCCAPSPKRGALARLFILAMISLAPVHRHQARHMVSELAARFAPPQEIRRASRYAVISELSYPRRFFETMLTARGAEIAQIDAVLATADRAIAERANRSAGSRRRPIASAARCCRSDAANSSPAEAAFG